MPLSPTERSLRSSIAAHTLHAAGGTNTAPARQAFYDQFVDQVDPERTLPEAERAKRVAHARTAYFKQLALKSAKVRRERSERRAR